MLSRLDRALRVCGLLAGCGVFALGSSAFGQSVNEVVKIVAGDGVDGDFFGRSVGMSDGVVVVGADLSDENGFFAGKAYLFDLATGAQTAVLYPDDPAVAQQFGWSVAIDNGVVAIGAPGDSTDGNRSGAVYLFDATTGSQLAKLIAADGSADKEFGLVVAMDGGVVVVGADKDDIVGYATGSAYLFDVATGAQLFKLVADDGGLQHFFGNAVAIKDGIAAIGARAHTGNGALSGAVYLFDVDTGSQLMKRTPDDAAAFQQFGKSVGLADGVLAVGASGDLQAGNNSGSAYLFDVGSGNQLAKMVPDDGIPSHQFGTSIAIESGIVAVGAIGDGFNGQNAGAGYVFSVSTGEQLKLLASDGEVGDNLGISMATQNGMIVSGAYIDDAPGLNTGSAYVFDLDCPADLVRDFSYNFLDISEMINLLVAGDPSADFNHDGSINFFDIASFLAAYRLGCL